MKVRAHLVDEVEKVLRQWAATYRSVNKLETDALVSLSGNGFGLNWRERRELRRRLNRKPL